MTNAAATAAETVEPPMSAAETAALLARMRGRVPLDARVPPKLETPVPPVGPSSPWPRREPANDDGAPPALPGEPTPHEMGLVGLMTEIAEALAHLRNDAQRKFNEVQAEFKNEIAALKNENTALRLILENLRIRERGERGVDGDRGPPGRDGRDGINGSPGPRGEKGGRGQRGFEITGFLINEAEYCITPLFYDNSQGPTLNLRGLFEQYNRDSEDDDVAYATEQAGLSRARTELEAQRVRLGLPAK
jgi:hypothetical protein